MVFPCGVDQGEQHVAKLRDCLLFVLLRNLSLKLRNLFLHLRPHLACLAPVETHVRSLFLNAVSFDQRRQRIGNTTEHGLVAVLLLQLDLLPLLKHLTGIFSRSVTIDVGMAEHQLVALLVAHIGNVERAALTANLRVEHHVHQHVAQLFADVLCVALHQGVAQLKRLFYRVRTEALIRLLAVPRTFLPQVVKHVEQTPESRHLLFSCMTHLLFFSLQKSMFSILNRPHGFQPPAWQKAVLYAAMSLLSHRPHGFPPPAWQKAVIHAATVLLPHSSFLIPHSSFLIPNSSFLIIKTISQ